MRSTVARRLSTLASFYRYCHAEGIVRRNPAANVRRPKVDHESRTPRVGSQRARRPARAGRARLAPRSRVGHVVGDERAAHLRSAERRRRATSTPNVAIARCGSCARAASTSPSRSHRGPPGRWTCTSVSAAAGRSSSPPTGGGWTAPPPTAPSSGWPGGPGSPSRSPRTACATRSSPPRSTPASPLRDVQEAASHADPRDDDALRPRPPVAGPARHLRRRRLRRRRGPPSLTTTLAGSGDIDRRYRPTPPEVRG